jgi:hypothetical protein
MPLLQQSLFQFHELLKEEQPRLGNHLEQEGVVPSMYCTHWFNTMFAYSLPFEQLLRVWDVFLLEGMKVRSVGVSLQNLKGEKLSGGGGWKETRGEGCCREGFDGGMQVATSGITQPIPAAAC